MTADALAVATGAGTWSCSVGMTADALAVAAGGETVWLPAAAAMTSAWIR
jgi:hypothetical protein